MKVVDISGRLDYMDVKFDDGKVVRIDGELIYHGFIGFKDNIDEWMIPKGKPISENERLEIIDAVLEEIKASGSQMNIVFE